jgi:hypothetical protein
MMQDKRSSDKNDDLLLVGVLVELERVETDMIFFKFKYCCQI